MSDYVRQHAVASAFAEGESWVVLSEIEQSIKRKIEAVGVPLKDWDVRINYGIKTGCNEAFIIDGATRDRLIAEDPKSAEIIRPILRGRDIKRYGFSFKDQWLIASHNGYRSAGRRILPVDINQYPAIKAHLDQYWEAISKRGDKGVTPYNLRNCAYMDDLNKQKIVWGELSDLPKFTFDAEGKYAPLNTAFLMTGQSLGYIIAFLNSPVSKYYFSSNIATSSGVGTIRWLKYTVETLPIPLAVDEVMKEIECLVMNLDIGDCSSEKLGAIDRRIYNLYGFTNDEIAFIEHTSAL